MKLVRYGASGAERPGLIDQQGAVRDLSEHVSDIGPHSVTPESLKQLSEIDPSKLPLVEKRVRFGPCVGNIGKFIGIGLNYVEHAREAHLVVPPEPPVFLKATSSVIGANDTIRIPRTAKKTDWEIELAFVIGREAKYVSEAEAEDHIAGYCVANDVTERAFQIERQGQWTKGKSCDTFGPIGPWFVTKDEVVDPNNLRMWLKLNGDIMQDENTSDMVYKPPFLVSYLSQFMTLYPGDVVQTGTPYGVGVGMTPHKFMKNGDILECGIDGLGVQKHDVVDDD